MVVHTRNKWAASLLIHPRTASRSHHDRFYAQRKTPALQLTVVEPIIVLPHLRTAILTHLSKFMDSGGGNSVVGAYVSDVIRASCSPIHAIVIAQCQSAAFDILQACHRRIAYKNARLMFHATVVKIKINASRKKNTARLDEALSDDVRLLKALAKRSGQTLKQICEWADEEKLFTSKEALKLGFIDKIL